MNEADLHTCQVNNFAVAFFVPPMFAAWAWGTYIFFAVFLFVGIFWVWFALPETKGATLEDMDRVFKSHTGHEDALMLAEIRRNVGLIQASESSATEKGPEKQTIPLSSTNQVETV